MRKLFEQYKDMVIDFGLVGTLIAIVLMLLGSLGTQTSTLVIDREYGTYLDSDVFQEIAARPGPEITTNEEMQWTAGAEVFPEQAFTGRDYEGRELELEVKQIVDANEQDITSLYHPQTGSVIFPEPGCYYFTLKVMDSKNKITVEKRPLVIDR